jgi:hypothetical protein
MNVLLEKAMTEGNGRVNTNHRTGELSAIAIRKMG